MRSSQGTYCATLDGGVQSCGAVWIDINGKNSPNTIARDIFQFQITKNTILPSRSTVDCNMNGEGWTCIRWIIEKGNMDYLRGK
ncbi:hypothetical protein J6E39_01510 [bacterium]|nr:hypothetical protein [bacterium]